MKLLISLKYLFALTFVLALAEAFPGYIRSTFLEEFVDVQWVGLFFVAAAFCGIIAINLYPYFIKKLSNYKLSIIILILAIISNAALAWTHNTIVALIAFTLSGVTLNLIWINMDVFLERFTKNVTTGKTRGLYNSIRSFAWVCSPLIVGYLIGDGNYRLIYILATFYLIAVLIIILVRKKRLSDHINYIHHKTWVTLKNIFSQLNLRGIFAIGFLLQLFYMVAVIYIPIHLHENIGFSWLQIGGIFTFMLLPFVLLEIPAGMFADKYSGEKKILYFGFIILITSTALIFYTESTNPVVWALILFLSRCGAALIEITHESYFFKIVDVENLDYIDFFRNIKPLSYIIGTGLSVLALSFLPLSNLFFILALVLLSGLYFTGRLPAAVKKIRD